MPRSLCETKAVFRFRCANSYILTIFIYIYVCLILGSQTHSWRVNSMNCTITTKELIHTYTVCIHLHMPRSRHTNSYIHTRALGAQTHIHTMNKYVPRNAMNKYVFIHSIMCSRYLAFGARTRFRCASSQNSAVTTWE